MVKHIVGRNSLQVSSQSGPIHNEVFGMLVCLLGSVMEKRDFL